MKNYQNAQILHYHHHHHHHLLPEKSSKYPNFLMIFARKMPEFDIIIDQKYFKYFHPRGN